MVRIHQTSVTLCPPSVSLSGWSVPVLLCPESSHSCEWNLLTLMPPLPPWTTGLQSFEEGLWVTGRRTAWNVLFALRLRHWLWRWCFLVLFFCCSFQLLSSTSVISPLSIHCHPLYEGQVLHRTLQTPSPPVPHPLYPLPSVSLTTFCFYRTLMAVFKTHCDV